MPSSDDAATPAASTTAPSAPQEPRLRHAYKTLLPAILALKPEEMEQLNLEPYSAMITVVGAWPSIQTMREQIVTHLPTFDLKSFDEIEERAMAMGFAHTHYLSSQTPPEALPALNEKAVKWRDLLLHVCQGLVQWGLLDQTRIDAYKGANGYKPVSTELGGLIGVLREHWSTVSARAGVLPAELDEAEYLVDQMVSAQGARKQGATTSEAARIRQGAFTLLIQAYDEATAAIRYLRRKEGDADTIIPPLYQGRRAGPKTSPTEPAGPVTPPVAGPTPAGPAAPVAPAPQPVSAPVVSTTPLPPMGPSTPGGPGGSPFIS